LQNRQKLFTSLTIGAKKFAIIVTSITATLNINGKTFAMAGKFLKVSVLLMLFTAPCSAAPAENLDLLMNGLFAKKQPTYIGFDSVAREDIPLSSAFERKYLIVDFRFDNAPPSEQLQASVHKICMTMIKDRDLIQSLSDSGYDMIAVAFDRQTQYDCL
jgi:hypothetical protein